MKIMSCRFKLLEKSLSESPVVEFGDYPYFVNPVSDGVPYMDPELLEEVVDGIIEVSELDCDLILAPEAMGIPLAVGVSLRTGIPYSIIRKRRYGLPGEISLDHSTGYSRSPMYINGLIEDNRVMILDDVVSTGGTARSIIVALKASGITVTEICAVFNKSPDIHALSMDLGVPIRHLVTVEMRDGKPVAVE